MRMRRFFSDDRLMAIPLTHYRVLRLDGVIESGMSHRQSQQKE